MDMADKAAACAGLCRLAARRNRADIQADSHSLAADTDKVAEHSPADRRIQAGNPVAGIPAADRVAGGKADRQVAVVAPVQERARARA